ncbi:DHA2 family efflux MFS transporter permease subunit [Sporolactobacillus shoreicorticis]|uniref:DHA2 family efflux MFS transporter permease subunit n=1 Tax=Sporolactobacillus shoreicorticis TaxID=1923877 RepID=A0ABW5S2M7_9BACL|nr:DHA2 family efflux MFS transporter permease subunit [Sporolactobacillus shoreicorticis]MCO7126538.1 DHA2 family efflux MFS transporter permease subunit [Sporolactobacillus shoreicorticis]
MELETQQAVVTNTNEKVTKNVIIMLAILFSGYFVIILDDIFVNVAIARIMVEFHVAPNVAQWLGSSRMLVLGILVPVSAFFIQRFTTKQLFTSAMSLFFLGTILSGISTSFELLLTGRVLQAIGGAIILPMLMNLVLVTVPVARRGAAMGTVQLMVMFAPALGPTISGLIVQNLSWRWLFFIVLPIAALCILSGLLFLKNVTEQTRPTIDILSFILSVFGFGGIVYGFSSAGKVGFVNPMVMICLAIGLASLALFAWRQLKLEVPMLDLRVFRFKTFRLTIVFVIIIVIIISSMTMMLPIYMQSALAFSAVLTGLIMMPGGIINGLISPVTGTLYDKFGPKGLLIPGIVLLIATLFALRFVQAGVNPWIVSLLYALLMTSMGMVMMPAQTNGLNNLPKSFYPHGTALLETVLQVSGAIGTAFFITIMQTGQQSALKGIQKPGPADMSQALTVGVRHALTAALILALIGFIITLFVKRVRIQPSNE